MTCSCPIFKTHIQNDRTESIEWLVNKVKEAAGKFPDLRTGKNTQYELEDATLGAFSVFFHAEPLVFGVSAGDETQEGAQ